VSAAEPEDGAASTEERFTRDSADIQAILADEDLSDTQRWIRIARRRKPENPARALRLLHLIGIWRPVDRLIEDAERFDERDAGQILGVAALHRSIPDTAAILLAKWGSTLATEVARTFARQRLTSDVAEIIVLLKTRYADREETTEIVDTMLKEIAWGGDVPTRGGGRTVRDVELIHVHLVGGRRTEEAHQLLTRVLARQWEPGFAYDLAVEFQHDTPQRNVLGDWARATVEAGKPGGKAIDVMRDLIHRCGPIDSADARRLIADVGRAWPAEPLARLGVSLMECDCDDRVVAVYRSAARRPELYAVALVIKECWAQSELAGVREELLHEAVVGSAPRSAPLTVAQVNELAKLVADLDTPDAPNQIRDLVRLDGCRGADLADLLEARTGKRRRAAGLELARRLAEAAKAGTVDATAVAGYIGSLRGRSWPPARQAADDAVNELTGIAHSSPDVVADVAVCLFLDDRTRWDAEAVLRRYLLNHAVVSAADLVTLVRKVRGTDLGRRALVDALRETVRRWPPSRRREAIDKLRAAGFGDEGDQISRS
jgi:hypothetical protein